MQSVNALSPVACVCVVLLDEHGRVLLVHRKQGNGVCLPGGKADPGEHLDQAAAREMREETGVMVNPEDLVPIFTGPCSSDGPHDHMTTAFLAGRWQGTVGTGEALMRPYWGDWNDLFLHSPFADYNLEMARRGLVTHFDTPSDCPRQQRWREALGCALSARAMG